MPTKIFVGSLGNNARAGDLRQLFENYGNVVECDIVNRCGFVHMENEQDALEAIRNLNNTSFNGQTINVEYGKQKDRGSGGDRGRPMRSGPYDNTQRGGGMGGRRDFNRDPMDSGMGRGGDGYRNTYQSPMGGGYGGNFRPSGEDRRGFALPDHEPYSTAGGRSEGIFSRRGDLNNYDKGYSGGRSYDSRGYGNNSYQQRDSGFGPMRRGTNSYEGGRGNQYEDNSRSAGYGSYGRHQSGGYGGNNNERNSNYSSMGGGRGGYGEQGSSRGMSQDNYNRRF